MSNYPPTLSVRDVALALCVIELDTAKRDQLLLKTVLSRHNGRNISFQKLVDNFPDGNDQAPEKAALIQAAASSQEQQGALQRCFDYSSERTVKNRLLIISHCNSGEDVSFRLTDALALEETAVEKAMLLKIDADREGLLAQAAAMNSILSYETLDQTRCLYEKTADSVEF